MFAAHISCPTPKPPAVRIEPFAVEVAFVVFVITIDADVAFPVDVTCCKLPTFVAVATIPVNPLPSPINDEACTDPLTPTPPYTISAPLPVEVATVEFVIVI